MYEYPERKKYMYTIPTIKGNLDLELEQATAQETKDFYLLIEQLAKGTLNQKLEIIKELNTYYIALIKKSCNYKRYNLRKRKLVSLVKGELESYIDEIIEILHPLRKSIYVGTKMPKMNGKKPRNGLFTNEKEAIAEKTGIPADEIYNRLTMEQIGWYLDKIVYEAYETFKEGKAINDKISSKDGLTEDQKRDLELIRQNLHSQK